MSRWLVGSSQSKRRGWEARARASASRSCCPLDSSQTGRLTDALPKSCRPRFAAATVSAAAASAAAAASSASAASAASSLNSSP